MQYLLSEKEYECLSKKSKEVRDELLKTIQFLCVEVATHKPTDRCWNEKDKSPWGCIKNSETDYCDECPAEKHCPYVYKNFSK